MVKYNLKAQVAMEFMLLVGILLLFFAAGAAVVSKNTLDLNQKREDIIAFEIVTQVQKELNIAARVEDGYYREFSLPQQLFNKDYSIQILNNQVILSTDVQDFWRDLPASTGNVTKGLNTIQKTNGTIIIN